MINSAATVSKCCAGLFEFWRWWCMALWSPATCMVCAVCPVLHACRLQTSMTKGKKRSICDIVNAALGPQFACHRMLLKSNDVSINDLQSHAPGSNRIVIFSLARTLFSFDFDGQCAVNPAQPLNVDMRLPGWKEKLAGSSQVEAPFFTIFCKQDVRGSQG